MQATLLEKGNVKGSETMKKRQRKKWLKKLDRGFDRESYSRYRYYRRVAEKGAILEWLNGWKNETGIF